MADIQFYEADSDDSSESGDDGILGSSDGYDSDTSNPDFGLGPLQKLEKYMLSEHSYTRQVVAKNLLETLRSVETPIEAEKVLQAMVKLASDQDSAVRTEVMEQMSAISLYVHEMQHLFDHSAISLYILPTLVKCLQDCNAQVRKTSQSSTVYIIQEKIVSHVEVESMVIPAIIELAEPDGLDDFRAEAIVMMTKLAPLLGSEVATRSFLDKFLEMCSDTLFHVRKVCATNFGEMCSVVGSKLTESKLLPKFTSLCEDDVWGVRNACTECFMQVSKACPMSVRRGELSRLFIGLLSDQSRWVRMAAFQSLGAFISTFADPSYTGLEITEDGKIIPYQNKSKNIRIIGDNDTIPASECTRPNDDNFSHPPNSCAEEVAKELNSKARDSFEVEENVKVKKDEEEGPEFNSFNYWRSPIYDVSSVAEGTLSDKSKFKVQTEINEENCSVGDVIDNRNPMSNISQSPPTVACDINCLENVSKVEQRNENKNLRDGNHMSTQSDAPPVEEKLPIDESVLKDIGEEMSSVQTEEAQNNQPFIVPPELLQHYLSMVDTNQIQTLDAEVMKHCAFSFPAVTFALGRRNWYLLRRAYESLARDLQWKVRRTLSSSIHEMAVILGEELTMSDLLPIFDEFLKDLDEVRIGVLKHLTDFLRLLKHDVRRQYLPRVADFLSTDNCRNWRFRLDLTEQLIELLDLFSPTDIIEHLSSIALILADDRVAQVRYMSIYVLSKIIKKLSLDVCVQLWSDFVDCVKSKFYQSNHYGRRQLFAHLCSNLLESNSVTNECFVETFLPRLITLSQDRVPNVRLAVAVCVFKHLIPNDYFMRSSHQYQESLNAMIENLKKDPDNDVQRVFGTFASCLESASDVPLLSEMNEISTNVPNSSINECIRVVDARTDNNTQAINSTLTDNLFLSFEY